MKLLIDTHVLIWALTDSKTLRREVREALSDSGNDVFVSIASILEIAIKISVGKLEIEGVSIDEMEDAINDVGFEMIQVSYGDCATLSALPFGERHKDPFDRLIVSQAINRKIPLVSNDKRLFEYEQHGLGLF